MKKVIDKDGRIMYKFSHRVAKGGWMYVHKTTANNPIQNKTGLRNVLEAIVNKFKLIDSTIKIYEDIFFLFFHLHGNIAPALLIKKVQMNIDGFAEWHAEYVFSGVYDLQEKFLRKDLQRFGYDYDKG